MEVAVLTGIAQFIFGFLALLAHDKWVEYKKVQSQPSENEKYLNKVAQKSRKKS